MLPSSPSCSTASRALGQHSTSGTTDCAACFMFLQEYFKCPCAAFNIDSTCAKVGGLFGMRYLIQSLHFLRSVSKTSILTDKRSSTRAQRLTHANTHLRASCAHTQCLRVRVCAGTPSRSDDDISARMSRKKAMFAHAQFLRLRVRAGTSSRSDEQTSVLVA